MRLRIAMLPALFLGGALIAQGNVKIEGEPPTVEGELVTPAKSVVSPGAVPTIVPASAAAALTNRANSIPWSWTPTHFQAPYLEKDLPNALVIRCIGFRHGNRSDTGATIDLEMWLGYTTYTHLTITNNYANNANQGALTKVYNRKMYKVPDMVNPNTDPKFFIGQIPLDSAFVWSKQTGRNLLWEAKIHGNSNNNRSFSYFPEQGTSDTTRIYSNGNANATTGFITRNLAPVLSLDLTCKVSSDSEKYGEACRGTGGFGGIILPGNYESRFGTSNNYFPHGRANMRYQQAHDGTEVGTSPRVIDGLSLRQDDRTTGRTGGAQTILIKLGQTDKSPNATGADFDKNFDTNGSTVVFSGNVNLPTLTGVNPDPQKLFAWVKFTTRYTWIPRPGKNLLIEVQNSSTSNVLHFEDAASNLFDVNASRIYNLTSATASMATSGTRNYALVIGLDVVGGVGRAKPSLCGNGSPKIGNATFALDVSGAKPSTAVLIGLGVSDKMFGVIPLPFDLNPFGFTGCKLLASLELIFGTTSDALGNASQVVPIPNDTALVKLVFFDQGVIFDQAANSGGLVFTNGVKNTIGEQ